MKNMRFLFCFIALSFNLSPSSDLKGMTDGNKWGSIHSHGGGVNRAVETALDSANEVRTLYLCKPKGYVALAAQKLEACEASAVQARLHADHVVRIANSFQVAQDSPHDAQVAFELGHAEGPYKFVAPDGGIMRLYLRGYAEHTHDQRAAVDRAKASAAAGAHAAYAKHADAILAAARDIVAQGSCCR